MSLQLDRQWIASSAAELRPLDPQKKTVNISSSRAINSIDQLVGAPIKYRFSIGQGYVWKPRESYFRIRASIKVGGERQGQLANMLSDDGEGKYTFEPYFGTAKSSLALAYNAPSTLFRSIALRLQDNIISEVNDVAHADTLLKRIKPKQYNETLTPHLRASYWSRHMAISDPTPEYQEDKAFIMFPFHPEDDDGIPSSSEVELLWAPDVGAFGVETLPPGDYEISLQPETKAAITAAFVQSLNSDQVDYTVDITGLEWFYTTEESVVPSTAGKTLLLDLIEDRVQYKPINNAGLTQQSFDVEPSLIAIAAAFQSGASINGVGPKFSKTVFTAPGVDGDAGIVFPGSNVAQVSKLWLKVGGNSYPENRYDFMEGSGYANQMYVDNQIAQGKVLARISAEGPKAFYELGPYAYWPLQLEAQCGPVQLHSQFAVPDGVTFSDLNLNALLFTRHRRVVKVEYDNVGRAVSVQGAEF